MVVSPVESETEFDYDVHKAPKKGEFVNLRGFS